MAVLNSSIGGLFRATMRLLSFSHALTGINQWISRDLVGIGQSTTVAAKTQGESP
jgi:hypothetical protein